MKANKGAGSKFVRRASVIALAIVGLAACGDDGDVPFITGTSLATTTTSTASTTTTVVEASPITFGARLEDRSGVPWIEIELPSDAPDGTAQWAVRVNGQTMARMPHSPRDVFAFGATNLEPGEAATVTLVAEAEDRSVLAESEPVELRH